MGHFTYWAGHLLYLLQLLNIIIFKWKFVNFGKVVWWVGGIINRKKFNRFNEFYCWQHLVIDFLACVNKLTSTSRNTSRMSGFLEVLFLVRPRTVLFKAFTRDLTASACGLDRLANIVVNSEVDCSRPYKIRNNYPSINLN